MREEKQSGQLRRMIGVERDYLLKITKLAEYSPYHPNPQRQRRGSY
jgi:hypothetical protein